MVAINPHINFNGNAEEAFNFYKSVFGGELTKIIRLKDLASVDFPVSEKDANAILYIGLQIGKNILIGNDVPPSMGTVNEQENRSKIAITVDTREEADKIYRSLSAEGTIEMPLMDSPWGTYYAMLRDKYGIEWTIQHQNIKR